MIIAHNVVDLNAFNKFYKNNKSASSSLEKVASGLRIVKANDDAAGLAISEKMRAQIRGIDMAIRNSQDGISLIQTAESGMSEVHSLVQRMRELTIQGANDTLNNEDRNAIQVELNQLKSEINNIASNTEFNNIKLLDGSIIGKSYSTVTKNITITPNIGIPDDGTEVNANLNVEGVDLKILFTNSGTNKVNISVKSGETTLGMANAVGTVAEIAPTIEWQKSLGDINSDYGMNIKQTTDGGYIVSGTNGAHDYEIIKLDSNGNTSWTKT